MVGKWSRRGGRVLRAGLMAMLLMPALSAWAQTVALVTDLSGRVTGKAPVTILAEIAAGTRWQLDAGSRLVVIYLQSGDEYTFAGPAQVLFRASLPQMLSGAAPQKKPNPLGGASRVTIKPVGVAQAGFVMRSSRSTARIRLLTLSGTRSLETSPEFRWQGIEADATYRFELTDDTGRSLHEAEVEATTFRLPPSVVLREGAGYTWEVSSRAANGRRYVSAGDFSIAPAELRERAEALRPPDDAPVSRRVAFATWLEQMELRDEARRYWRALSAERPQDTKLKALAAP